MKRFPISFDIVNDAGVFMSRHEVCNEEEEKAILDRVAHMWPGFLQTNRNVHADETPAERIIRLENEAENLALVQVREFAEGLTAAERVKIAEHLEGHAAYMLRIAAYLKARGGFGFFCVRDRGHEEAVDAQNKRAVKIDKALGHFPTHEVKNI